MDMEHGFVVVAARNEHRFFRSFHGTEEHARNALRKTVDLDALTISKADVAFAANGNVRFWEMTGDVPRAG